ncbi:hypothetical protein M011DRAFT_523665 [Sporormia fimetaria CBS 119925]|uniref:Uncharacterized protein n=1 Tax=Sporormia fimetaria CBS 119925 TaxID=1340428 RepID=A0A6A6VJ99_9PLEO|nr:hypothetical protein M011DRAFT_523665 [Sporormia fimetaria CBS 119925]
MSMAHQDSSSRACAAARIPKLTYRNPLPSASTAAGRDENSRSPSAKPPGGPASHAPAFSSARFLVPPETDALTPSQTSIQTKAAKAATPLKKKASAVRSFFTAREPSHLALEEYTKQQLKQAQEGKRPSAIAGLPNQKLPAHVPKVNSKWDGMPEALKKRDSNMKCRSVSSQSDLTQPTVNSSSSSDSSSRARSGRWQPFRTGWSPLAASTCKPVEYVDLGSSQVRRRYQSISVSMPALFASGSKTSLLPQHGISLPRESPANDTAVSKDAVTTRPVSSAKALTTAKEAISSALDNPLDIWSMVPQGTHNKPKKDSLQETQVEAREEITPPSVKARRRARIAPLLSAPLLPSIRRPRSLPLLSKQSVPSTDAINYHSPSPATPSRPVTHTKRDCSTRSATLRPSADRSPSWFPTPRKRVRFGNRAPKTETSCSGSDTGTQKSESASSEPFETGEAESGSDP